MRSKTVAAGQGAGEGHASEEMPGETGGRGGRRIALYRCRARGQAVEQRHPFLWDLRSAKWGRDLPINTLAIVGSSKLQASWGRQRSLPWRDAIWSVPRDDAFSGSVAAWPVQPTWVATDR